MFRSAPKEYIFGKIVSETKTQFTANMHGSFPQTERFMKANGLLWGRGEWWNRMWMRPFDQEIYDKQIAGNKHRKLVNWLRSYSWSDLTTEQLEAVRGTLR